MGVGKLNVCFLADRVYPSYPYSINNSRDTTNFSQYILFDRYNYGLKTHFYSFTEALNTVGNPDRKFVLLNESRTIVPAWYDVILKNRQRIENEFDLVFTYDEEILNRFSNARFVPIDANYWYGENDSSAVSSESWKHKTRNISVIASFKTICKMHEVRRQVARICKAQNLADTYGNFDIKPGQKKEHFPTELPFQHYRYSIVIENNISAFYFTEKLTNCFAAQTIPVYLGASQIHKFFNPDGIITISLDDLDNLPEILKQCTPEEYERRLPAVLDNFKRVQEFACPVDYMYTHYLREYFE